MRTLALHEIGEVIRKVRKERGLRLEDLADENISPATVSNIERGVAHVSPEKISYLLEKLDLPMNKLPEMLVKEQAELKKVKFKLLTVATLRQIGLIDEALQRLEELVLDETHPYIAHAYYFKGKCYMSKKKWKQAERALYNALRLTQQNPYKDHNMESASYLLLSLISYYQNRMEQALSFTDNGLETFVENGENQHIKILLYRNKGIYLHRLGRITEGMRLVQEVWSQIQNISDASTLLGFYWLRAEFSRLIGIYEESIEYAEEGIEIARRNKLYDSMCDLWIVLGSAYTSTREWSMAETSFKMALKLEEKHAEEQRVTKVYNRLGKLYMKQSRMEDARAALQKAIQYAEKYNDFKHLSTGLLSLGDLTYSNGKTEEAILYYKKALNLTQKHGYKEKEYKAWFSLAKCYDGVDEQEFQNCMRNMYNTKREFARMEVEEHDFKD
ncbi:helix-turn-helix domain-containing protein [Laceyella putida]|uniref:Helix-turn-helix domain-containing protein n=1 Tax=Laceyella putida TaxID=110101 RepID=A0ABW2RQF0_9BACL